MMYGMSSKYYWGGYAKVSRGPWFREAWVEEDGLDWFYTFLDNDNNKNYLLSNNLQLEDRDAMSALYKSHHRNNRLGWFAGGWLSFEMVTKLKYCKSSALGWRCVQWLGMTFALKQAFMSYTG